MSRLRTPNPPGDRPAWLLENPHLACVCTCTHCRDGRHRSCGHLVSCVLVPLAELDLPAADGAS